MIAIQKNVSLPISYIKPGGIKDAFSKMAINDSIEIPDKYYTANLYAAAAKVGVKVMVRHDKEKRTIRIWRIS